MQFKKLLLLLVLSLLTITFVIAQETTPTVPNITGLTVPDAAAVLHRAGLTLGAQQIVASDEPANMVTSQNPAPGEAVAPGTAVSVTVMRPVNMRLIYDENDFTLMNQSGQAFATGSLSFQAVDSGAAFTARRWNRVSDLPNNECLQLWSVVRTDSKEVDGCRTVVHWISTSNTNEHFWIAGQQTAFRVLFEGIERGVCPAASAGQVQDCPLYLPLDDNPTDISEYMYFTYTDDQFVVINRSAGRWLPTGQIRIGDGLVLGNPANFQSAFMGDAGFLAPGQCLVFTRDQAAETTLEACDVVARATLPADQVFWNFPFRMRGGVGRERQSCPAALPGERMICIVPR